MVDKMNGFENTSGAFAKYSKCLRMGWIYREAGPLEDCVENLFEPDTEADHARQTAQTSLAKVRIGPSHFREWRQEQGAVGMSFCSSGSRPEMKQL